MHKLPACNQGNRESKGGLFQMLLFLRTTLGDCLPYYHGTLALSLSHSPSPSLSLLSLSITFNPPIWGFFHLNDQLQRCRVKGEAQQSRGGLRRGVNWRADGKVQKELKIGKHTVVWLCVSVCACVCGWVDGWVVCWCVILKPRGTQPYPASCEAGARLHSTLKLHSKKTLAFVFSK